MIAHITGSIRSLIDREIILETGGIGYAIATPLLTGAVGGTLTLYTHLVIRDDAHELYGFVTTDERDLFRVLIGVSGVGPRTALAMLCLYTLPDLVRIIRLGDAKALSLVSGIGKKTAEKIVIDLKDKVANFAESTNTPNSDLVEALLSLGYKEHQLRVVVGAIDTTLPIEKQITQALQKIQK